MFLATLNPSHVIRVEISPLSQFFLAQSSALPFFTNGRPKDNTIIGT